MPKGNMPDVTLVGILARSRPQLVKIVRRGADVPAEKVKAIWAIAGFLGVEKIFLFFS